MAGAGGSWKNSVFIPREGGTSYTLGRQYTPEGDDTLGGVTDTVVKSQLTGLTYPIPSTGPERAIELAAMKRWDAYRVDQLKRQQERFAAGRATPRKGS